MIEESKKDREEMEEERNAVDLECKWKLKEQWMKQTRKTVGGRTGKRTRTNRRKWNKDE